MRFNTQINIDFKNLEEMLMHRDIPRDGHTRLVMNDKTVYALTGKHFYDDRRQTYFGHPIIEDYSCDIGEIIILVNFEEMVEN